MKRKSGFTLAEVLVSLAVIGVVAAMTLPTLMTSYQYNALGVSLAKFMSNTQAASRPYAVANERIQTAQQIADFADTSFDFRTTPAVTVNNMGGILVLKDGTAVSFIPGGLGADYGNYPIRKYGAVTANIIFRPNITGLPATVQPAYVFALTELGYIYPASYDAYNTALFRTLNYRTKATDFQAGRAAAACLN